jgi:hypothetical protein
MLRLGDRLLTFVASAWLVAAGTFLFVKGLDISLVACSGSVCGDFADLAPGITSFAAGVGMLLAWPFVVSVSSEGAWQRRLGVGLVCGIVVAALTVAPVLALTDRLGVPLWLCMALVSAIAIRPPAIARGDAIQGRVIVAVLLGAAVVVAEVLLDGDAYVLAFAMCVALTPPGFSGVDEFAVGWPARSAAAADAGAPEGPLADPDHSA